MPSEEYYYVLERTIGGMKTALDTTTQSVQRLTSYAEGELKDLGERTERQSNEWRQSLERLEEAHGERLEKLERWQVRITAIVTAVGVVAGYVARIIWK